MCRIRTARWDTSWARSRVAWLTSAQKSIRQEMQPKCTAQEHQDSPGMCPETWIEGKMERRKTRGNETVYFFSRAGINCLPSGHSIRLWNDLPLTSRPSIHFPETASDHQRQPHLVTQRFSIPLVGEELKNGFSFFFLGIFSNKRFLMEKHRARLCAFLNHLTAQARLPR